MISSGRLGFSRMVIEAWNAPVRLSRPSASNGGRITMPTPRMSAVDVEDQLAPVADVEVEVPSRP